MTPSFGTDESGCVACILYQKLSFWLWFFIASLSLRLFWTVWVLNRLVLKLAVNTSQKLAENNTHVNGPSLTESALWERVAKSLCLEVQLANQVFLANWIFLICLSVVTLVILIESLEEEKFKSHLTSWPLITACCISRHCLCLYQDGSRTLSFITGLQSWVELRSLFKAKLICQLKLY